MTDKIIFWLNAFLLQFCLAYYLQKNYDAEYYGIIDITNKPKKFFQTQNLVKFSKTWYYHDHIKKDTKPDISYLSLFEEKYKINLWKLAINERLFYRFNRLYKFSTDEILSILTQECKLFENILDEIKPNFLITYDPPLHHHKLFYELCKAKRVKPLVMYVPRVGQKCIIAQDGETLGLTNLNNIQSKNRSFIDLQNYRKSFDYSNTIKNYLSGRGISNFDKLQAVNDFVLNSDSTNIQTHYSYYGRNKILVLADAIKFLLKKKIRASFINKHFEINIDFNRSFVFFPLAVDEETNLLHYAPFFTNQLEVIRHVAKSLPVGYTLYVKEHPGEEVRGWKKISVYKEILEIPNVHLIHPSTSSEKLVEKCSLVVTIRGTLALDAAFYKKHSIIFGELPFSILPCVHKVKSLDELPQILRSSLQIEINPSDLDKYITWVENNSFDFDLLGFENKESKYFYSGGILVDVEISLTKMKSFLEENKDELDKLSLEYIKKIKQIKLNQNKETK
jgi:hypothetical protein